MAGRRALAWIVLSSALLFAFQSLSQPIGIVALRDSNTAGFGVRRDQAFPAYLERMLRAAGHDVQVWNAGVSGDTFDRMLARLDRYVPDGMRVVILQGGYNDLLRRNDPVWIAGYIQAIVSRLRARQIDVVLCGFFRTGTRSAWQWRSTTARSSWMEAHAMTTGIAASTGST